MQSKKEKLTLYFNLCLQELTTAQSVLGTFIMKCQNNFDYVTKIIEITNNHESEKSIGTYGNTVKSFIELSEIAARFNTELEKFQLRQASQNVPPLTGEIDEAVKREKFIYPKLNFEKFHERYSNNCIITYIKDKSAGLFYINEIGRSEYEHCISYIKDYFARSPVALQNRIPKENEIFIIFLEGYLFRAVRENGPITNENSEYDIYLLDVGETIKVNKSSRLYALPEKYQKIESQAILCKLLSVNNVSEVNISKYLSKNLYVKQIFTVQKINRDLNFLEVDLCSSNNPFERLESSSESSATLDQINSNCMRKVTNPFKKYKNKNHIYSKYISETVDIKPDSDTETENQPKKYEIEKRQVRNLQEFYESDAVSECTWKSEDDTTEYTDTDNFLSDVNPNKNEKITYTADQIRALYQNSLKKSNKSKINEEMFTSTTNHRDNILESDPDDSEVEEYAAKVRSLQLTDKEKRGPKNVSDSQKKEYVAFQVNNSILSYLEEGQTITLQCTHIAGVEWFFAHLICHELRYGPTLSELLMKMNSPHEVLRYKKLLTKPDKYKLVLSQYKDGRWYRARVATPLNEDPLRVMYVDYGNIEAVTLDRLCEWDPKFENLPFQAIPCRIAGIRAKGLNIHGHIFLKKLMLYKDLEAEILYKNNELWVNVKNEKGLDIAKELIRQGFATEDSYLPNSK